MSQFYQKFGASMLSLIMERPEVLDLIHEFNQGKFSITS